MNIAENIRKFNEQFNADDRDASFDYCFNYFQGFREQQLISELASPAHIEQSCLQLAFFLASWGMYRGNTELFKHSSRFLWPVMEAIAQTEPCIWAIDFDCYDETNLKSLKALEVSIRDGLQTLAKTLGSDQFYMTDTLVTKIMLGVFGNVPAFDSVFCKGCSDIGISTSFQKKALEQLAQFYRTHAEEIEALRKPTVDFITGEATHRQYPRAKIIDMAIFMHGEKLMAQ